MNEKEYSVSEAVRRTGVPSHVLRYWEEELQITIQRSAQGYRIYTESDLELFGRVKLLKEKGIQLKAIRVLLEEQDDGQKYFREQKLESQIREIVHKDRLYMNDAHADDTYADDTCTDDTCTEDTCAEDTCAKDTYTENTYAGDIFAGDTYSDDTYTDGTYANEVYGSAPETVYGIVLEERVPDNLHRFEMILKAVVEDVIMEQNEKLEQSLRDGLKDELDEWAMKYYENMYREAAASAVREKKSLWDWIRRK